MKKKILSMGFLAVLMMAIFTNIVLADSLYDEIAEKIDIDSQKIWNINFNMILRNDTVNERNIFVQDENGNNVNIKVNCGSDGKSVVVTPPSQGYDQGKSYTLIVSKEVKAQGGNAMARPMHMKFTIKNLEVDGENNQKAIKVCIDAGHGGIDNGQVGDSGLKEKDVNLSVALKLGKILNDNGLQVVYTRTGDNVDWSKDNLQPRFDISNTSSADCFVSIHCNTYTGADANGIETYYNNGDADGQILAQNIQNSLVNATAQKNRGAKTPTGNMPELKGTKATAVKVLLGFISNSDDEKKLASEDYQNKYAQAIANGILDSQLSSVVSVEDIIKTISVGDNFVLPTSVKAIMRDGSSKQLTVKWDNNNVDTTKAATYAYKGTVQGYNKRVNLALVIVSKANSNIVVCIDAGHGGYDTGAPGPSNVLEKDVNLAVSLKTGKLLENNGIKVVYTRSDDNVAWPSNEGLDLQKRCDIAKAANADYFICIHANSFNASSHGTETIYKDSNSQGQKLAQCIQNELIKSLALMDRGVKSDSERHLYVLRNNSMPAILTELAFISNPQEEKLLNSPDFQDKCAAAITKGILNYLNSK